MIELENVRITVPGFEVADVNLTVEAGEFFALLGPTGSGKTMILESIAGLRPISGGRIRIDGRDATHAPPESRNVGVVYQDSALFPHMNVEKNIRFSLRYRPADDDHARRLSDLIDQLGLGPLMKRSVLYLSGGEKQRVALARALAARPSALLLDEPLSALDSSFREEVRRALKVLHASLGTTFLLVTHDFGEALYLADRAAVIHQGRLKQVGAVQDIFRHPADPFTAGFVGMKNIFEAGSENGRVRAGGLELRLSSPASPGGGVVTLGIRPEDVCLSAPGAASEPPNTFSGVIRDLAAHGMYFLAAVETGGLTIAAVVGAGEVMESGLTEGQTVRVTLPPAKIRMLEAFSGGSDT
jgi:molybdate/tungstate transport system ATP-binding protein